MWVEEKAPAEPNVYEEQLRCQICDETRFRRKKGLLHSLWMSVFDVELLGTQTNCLICENCGYVHWFAKLKPPAQL